MNNEQRCVIEGDIDAFITDYENGGCEGQYASLLRSNDRLRDMYKKDLHTGNELYYDLSPQEPVLLSEVDQLLCTVDETL